MKTKIWTSFMLSVAALVTTFSSYAFSFSAAINDDVDAVSVYVGDGNLTFASVVNSPVCLSYAGHGLPFPDDLNGMPAMSGLRNLSFLSSPPLRSRPKLNIDYGPRWIVTGPVNHLIYACGFACNYGMQTRNQRRSVTLQTQVPCWPFATIATGLLVWRWCRFSCPNRPATLGLCHNCGSDLRAISGRCPECEIAAQKLD